MTQWGEFMIHVFKEGVVFLFCFLIFFLSTRELQPEPKQKTRSVLYIIGWMALVRGQNVATFEANVENNGGTSSFHGSERGASVFVAGNRPRFGSVLRNDGHRHHHHHPTTYLDPSSARTASSASRESSNSTKAKPGGFRATQTFRRLPYFEKADSISCREVWLARLPM